MKWISVKKYLPGHNKYVITRCLTSCKTTVLYLMAYYDQQWEFFDDDNYLPMEGDILNDYQKEIIQKSSISFMKVTHWCKPDKIKKKKKFIIYF